MLLVVLGVLNLICFSLLLLKTSGSGPNMLAKTSGPFWAIRIRVRSDGKTVRQVLVANGRPNRLCFELGYSPHRGGRLDAKQT